MAVYEGARPRTIALPRAPRRRGGTDARATSHADGRPGRPATPATSAWCSGSIVISFLLAFFWLAQVVRQSATSYDIGRLEVIRGRLDAQEQDLRSDLSRLGHEPAIRKLALDAGLTQLGEPIVLPAR